MRMVLDQEDLEAIVESIADALPSEREIVKEFSKQVSADHIAEAIVSTLFESPRNLDRLADALWAAMGRTKDKGTAKQAAAIEDGDEPVMAPASKSKRMYRGPLSAQIDMDLEGKRQNVHFTPQDVRVFREWEEQNLETDYDGLYEAYVREVVPPDATLSDPREELTQSELSSYAGRKSAISLNRRPWDYVFVSLAGQVPFLFSDLHKVKVQHFDGKLLSTQSVRYYVSQMLQAGYLLGFRSVHMNDLMLVPAPSKAFGPDNASLEVWKDFLFFRHALEVSRKKAQEVVENEPAEPAEPAATGTD